MAEPGTCKKCRRPEPVALMSGRAVNVAVSAGWRGSPGVWDYPLTCPCCLGTCRNPKHHRPVHPQEPSGE